MAINGNKWTATRQVVEKAASFIKMPHYLFAIVSVHNQLNGLFIGDCVEAWEKAADLSSQIHVAYKDKPYNTILSIAPQMYDDMWTAAKAMYKLEPVAADGGTIIVYAPHITEVSYTHAKILDEIGYHVRDYFLKQPERFAKTPRAAMAHSTHLKGVGTYENGIEKPRIKVILATGISRQRCEKIDLGYMNREDVKISDYENKEDEGILVVHHAGEVLYRLAGSSITEK
jgi:nickel-dependent lactate racemase